VPRGTRQFTRSANVERDRGASAVDSYVPTVRALELIERLAEDLERGTGGAYSIIGPYGSGKSSAALFIEALLGKDNSSLTIAALAKLKSSNPELAKRFARGRRSWSQGFIAATAAAQREPVATTVIRALRSARPGIKRVPGEDRLSEWLEEYTVERPMLLVLDEFGKNLEFYAEHPAESDLYLLQQLAERAVDPQAAPLFVITLQHLAFEEYLSLSAPTVQREWAKIQGRFADVPFAETPRQVRRLIASALSEYAEAKDIDVGRAEAHMTALHRLKLDAYMDSASEVLAVYPLHPLSVAALPELCAKFAQNERTLFSFLRSNDPHSVTHYLRQPWLGGALPRLKLDSLYDYFVESARSQLMAARGARRWLEIEGRIRDAAATLDTKELAVLKAVGVLNLVSAGSTLRASRDVIVYACTDDPSDRHAAEFVSHTLEKLEAGNVLTYRQFADEFRIWFGSDFDLTAAYDQAQRDIEGQSVAAMLETVRPRSPLVAGEFSVRTGVLRSFECRYADHYSELKTMQPLQAACDGVLALWVGEKDPTALENEGPRPLVLAIPHRARKLRASVTEVAAYRRVLERSTALEQDWVARRELVERLVLAEQRLDAELWSIFEADAARVEYQALEKSGARDLEPGRATQVLSRVGNEAYFKAPVIRNEVIGRHELTSQGAAARRELVEALVERSNEENVGITGFGPEYAMYLALLRDSGIHRKQDGGYVLSHPEKGHKFDAVWEAMKADLDEASHFRKLKVSELMERVSHPPYGLRQGPFFVLFPALLLQHQQELAVYEQGVFQPNLGADLLERMAKNPEKYEVRSFGLQKGRRSKVLRACLSRLGISVPPRDFGSPHLLHVVRPLLRTYRLLPLFAHNTKRVSPEASQVRNVLTNAKEPDQLLFVELPRALGLEPFGTGVENSGADPDTFAEQLARALKELQACYGETLAQLKQLGADQLRVVPGEFRQALRLRAAPLSERAGQPDVRSFLLVASDTVLDDEAWFENLAMNLSSKAPKIWRDDDVTVFEANLRARIGALQRLEFLYQGDADVQRATAAYRICLTEADGTEHQLTAYGTRENNALRKLVQRTITEAIGLGGPQGGAALARLLIEELAEQPIGKAQGK
jgi:hypothetical protein